MLDSFFYSELIPTWNFVATKLSLRKWFRNEYMKGGFVHSHNVTGKDLGKDLQIASTRIEKGRKFWHSLKSAALVKVLKVNWILSDILIYFWWIMKNNNGSILHRREFLQKASNDSAFDVPLLGCNVMPFYRQISIKINSLLWVISLRSLSASATKSLSRRSQQQHSLSKEVY